MSSAEKKLKEYQKQKRDLIGGKDKPFDEFPFVWANKGDGGWQAVKKAASDADLFVYKAKTGFGSALDMSIKLLREAHESVLTKTKRQKYQDATEAIELVHKTAKKLREGTLNVNFQKYFTGAINEGKTRHHNALEELKKLR